MWKKGRRININKLVGMLKLFMFVSLHVWRLFPAENCLGGSLIVVILTEIVLDKTRSPAARLDLSSYYLR